MAYCAVNPGRWTRALIAGSCLQPPAFAEIVALGAVLARLWDGLAPLMYPYSLGWAALTVEEMAPGRSAQPEWTIDCNILATGVRGQHPKSGHEVVLVAEALDPGQTKVRST